MLAIPARWTSELQSLARIIFGFLTFRHGMEQVLGFPGAWIEAPTLSFFGVVKLLCLPGGLLMMLGLFTRPVAITLAVAHLIYWFVEPLPQALFEGARLFGSRGAPTDHLILPALFFVYVFLTGPGTWSLDRLLNRDAGSATRNPAYVLGAGSAERTRLAHYSLGVLRIVAGFLFIFHGTGKIAPTLDPTSLRALAMVLEVIGGPVIMLGLFTRPLAFLLSGEMAFAYFLSHAPEGFWGSFVEPNQEAAILFCFLYLFFWAAGPGAWSLDGLLRQRRMNEEGTVMKPQSVVLLLVMGVLFLPATAWAQSGITGVVRDTSGGILPGVTVEAASPALIAGTSVTVTNEEGRYRFVDLRPGSYSLTFSLAGFQSLRRDGIELQAEFTATVNAELAVGSVEETITVTGEPPVVDVVSVRQQTQITEETLQAIPVNRRMASWAAILPGATVTRPSDHDVGGIQGERGAFSIHGGPTVDQSVDGMYQVLLGGRTIYSFNTHAIQEVVVETGAGSAESFSGGSVLHYVYKDGGNQFSGTFSATHVTGATQSDNLSDALRARGLSKQLQQSGGIKESFDVGGGIGGPLRRDRLWFYWASRISGTGQYQTGNFYNTTQGTMFYTPDESRPAFTKERFRDLTARLTWQAAEKHRFAGLLSVQRNCTCFYMLLEPAVLPAPEAVGQHTYSPLYIPMLSWTSPATRRLLFEAAASAQVATNHTKRQPETGLNDISITDIGLNRLYNSRAANLTQTGSYTVNPVRQYHQKFAASFVTGTHNFKAGVNLSQFADPGPGRFTDPNQISQARSYTFRNRVPESVTIWAVPHGLRGRSTNTGVFAQDQWTIDRMTLNLGVRYSEWKGSTPEQVLPAGPFVPERRVEATTNNPLFRSLNPRTGVAYDVFGDGRTALKASLGRYVGVEIAPVSNPAANMSLSTSRSWNDINGNYVPDCDLRNPAAQGECGPWNDLGFGKARQVTTRYADDALEGFNKQSHNWQGSVSVQHQLRPGMGLNVGYFRTWYGGFLATDNLAVTPADFDQYCITAPVDSRLPASGEQLCGFYDLRPNKFGLVDNLVTQASHYGDQSQVYNGVDATLNGRFLQGGQFQGGVSIGRTVTDTCLVVDSPEAAREGYCNVVPPWSAGTQVKFLVVYPLPWNLRTSAVYQNMPGIPYTASYVTSNADVARSLGRNLAGGARSVTKDIVRPQTLFEPRLQQVDLRLSRIFRAGTARLTANVDLYNVFNENAVLQQNTRYGDTWREVSLVMGGRLLRFTGQFDF